MWTTIHDPRVAGLVGLAATAAATAYSATLNHSSAEAVPAPKTRVVVLGSGWSSMTFMKELSPKDKEKYDITVVSPRNYFLYTPLLPAVASGTCEERSIVESVRNIVHGKGQYYEAQCEQVDVDRKAIWACKKNADGSSGTCFEMQYDLLVMGVGAGTSSFGIRGVDQNCLYFKSIEDANALRRRVSECFEEAALPDTSEELRNQLLTFVVCGGGPTGVEVAAELHDMIKDDLAKMYPSLLPHVKISLLEMMPRVLGMYSSKVSEYTQQQFEKAGIELRLNTRVTEVQPGKVQMVDKEGNAATMAFGACVWATGIGMNPLVRQVKDTLPQQQTNPRAIVTDPYFRVEGSQNSIWAMGDAASIAPPATSQCVEHILAHADQPSSPIVSLQQLPELLLKASKEHPHLAAHAEYLAVMLRGSWSLESVLGKAGVHANAAVHKQVLGDIENKDSLTREELASLLGRMDAQSRPLPPTAQRARQQGAYLARLFQQHQMDASGEVPPATKPFQYSHQGSAAYVGQDKAVLDTVGWGTMVGSHAGVVWKGFETMSQISFKNQVLVGIDWFRSKIFGRDISKYVDALPYVDVISEESRRQSQQLIQEEMQRMSKTPADYLKELPPPPESRLEDDALMKAEFRRIEQKLPFPAPDAARLRLDEPPKNKQGDVREWEKSVSNARSQLEHQSLRILNLELLLKFGLEAWTAQNIGLEQAVKSLEAQHGSLKRSIDDINRHRKLQQLGAKGKMQSLEEEWWELLHKNLAIEEAVSMLQRDIAAMEAKCKELQPSTAENPQPSTAAPAAANAAESGAPAPSAVGREAPTAAEPASEEETAVPEDPIDDNAPAAMDTS